jgi:hypothetical protein
VILPTVSTLIYDKPTERAPARKIKMVSVYELLGRERNGSSCWDTRVPECNLGIRDRRESERASRLRKSPWRICYRERHNCV